MDEVGRGALAGPVSVGAVMIHAAGISASPPTGLADSKALSPKRREQLVEPIVNWANRTAVGHATSKEVDQVGILGALRFAGQRALQQIQASSQANLSHGGVVVLLDGNHDWLTSTSMPGKAPPVQLVLKGDSLSATIAAASVIAKVTRDAAMTALDLEHPEYQWASNKGYASAAHQDAIRRLGTTGYHRVSWRLPQ